MFEKEAEIYALSNFGFRGKNSQRVLTAKIDYQKGAEFGFQKGIKARINTTTISDCPIKDEWHFVKDGDLPKDKKEVLVYMWGSFYIGYYSEKYDENNRWHFEDFSEESEQVTAWKEIVPPDIEEE